MSYLDESKTVKEFVREFIKRRIAMRAAGGVRSDADVSCYLESFQTFWSADFQDLTSARTVAAAPSDSNSGSNSNSGNGQGKKKKKVKYIKLLFLHLFIFRLRSKFSMETFWDSVELLHRIVLTKEKSMLFTDPCQEWEWKIGQNYRNGNI